MIKFLKILSAFLCCFILQSILEIILMSVLAKMGVSYMDVEVKGESFKEVIEAISVYYFYSKLFYTAPVYFVLTVASTLYFFRNKEINIKSIAIVHFVITLLIFLVLWFAFGNDFTVITNPLLGLLLAGFLIYLLALQF